MNPIEPLLARSGVILADGAMGTMLFAAGLESGGSPELWNVEHPDRVSAIQRAYLDAGAQVLLTNTFGGSPFRLESHGLGDRVRELNRAGAQVARHAVTASGREALVAGDIGPSGQMLSPMGTLEYADAVKGFAEQAAGLIEGGVDVIWIETMSDLEEVHAAMEGTRQVSADIPIIATMTFDTRGRTMMGVKPEQAIEAILEWGAVAVGGNCGNGPDEMLAVVNKMHAAHPEAILVAKSNAGKPVLEDGKVVYRASPETMAEVAKEIRAAGARIIGGCCGTTPAHIGAMKEAVN